MNAQHIRSLRRTAVTATVALAAAAGLVGVAGPASSADKPGGSAASTSAGSDLKPGGRTEKNGVCEANELCLFFFQNKRGAFLDLFVSDGDFSNDVLRGSSAGNLSNANNNTRSYRNKDTFYWRVYDGANFTGTEILCIAPGDRGNFTRAQWDLASSANFSSTAC